MNTTHPLSTEQTALSTVKTVGSMFLIFIITSISHYTIIESNLIMHENTAELVQYIKSNDLLFRAGVVLDLLLFTIGIILGLSLYIMLKPVHKALALLAFVFILLQTIVAVVIETSSFIVLSLVSMNTLVVFSKSQLEVLLSLVVTVRTHSYEIVTLFFTLGFSIFCYLFLKSNYIPKLLAWCGMISHLLMLSLNLVQIMTPQVTDVCFKAASVLVMLFQITLGVWLLTKKTTRSNP